MLLSRRYCAEGERRWQGVLDRVGKGINLMPMGRHDWYRNSEWSADTEVAFRVKLSRSRGGRPQYLQIQASCLVANNPLVALKLIDEYFETDDEFNVPTAWCVRAQAYFALGRIDETVAAYKAALEWEKIHPHVISTARIDLPKLVAERRLSDDYDYVLHILTTRFVPMDHQFPSTRYLWNGSCALISNEMGNVAEARAFAERALRAAAQTESPFRYHRTVGLVRETSDDFGSRLKRIAQPQKLRSLLRLISRQ